MKCYIKCTDGRHDPIEIRHDEETFIGRLKSTEIKDVMCSRNQVSLKANFTDLTVEVKQLGVNSSGINAVENSSGYATQKDKTYKMQPGDVLEILLGKYFYEIIFENVSSAIQSECASKTSSVTSVADTNLNGIWESVDGGKLLIFTPNRVKDSVKLGHFEPLKVKPRYFLCTPGDVIKSYVSNIAAYDLDGTIITTKSEKRFPQDVEDWKIFLYISSKLNSLHEEGYKIVFFTNQNGISLGKYKVEDYKTKTEAIVKKLNIPIQVFAATGKTLYRKPRIGMWNYLCDHKNGSIKINKSESLFVGDAAGRPANSTLKTKKDHSSADRLFAMNVGIKFFTPEEHFKKHSTAAWVKPLFDPKSYVTPSHLLNPADSRLVSKELEVVLMVGAPGSGKSTFANNHLVAKGYKWINQDTLKSWQNCVKQLENAISAKQNSVIDNTNNTKESRRRYIDIAKKFKVPCRCFVLDVSFAHAKHNNIYRELTDSTHKPINEIVMNSYRKHFEEPAVTEGFAELVKVNFIPKFQNSEDETLYKMYLVDS